MKRVLAIAVLLMFVISLPVYGQEINYPQGAVEKGKQGIINTFTGWLEIPVQISKGYKQGVGEEGKNNLLGGVLGFFRGLGHGVGRTASGLFQLVTCVLPNPQDNQDVGIPLDSQYAWEEGQQYSVFNDGFQPIGNKVARGFTDSFGCLLEVPGQLQKAAHQNTFIDGLVGVCKAVFYPVARLASGVYDLATFIFPNDTKTYGRPFDEENPWDAVNRYSEETAQEQEEEPVDFFALNLNAP
jgi:putative exosortase-associated protein (TIGR04073 family)